MKSTSLQRKYLACLLVMICLVMSGCFNVSDNLTINEDGSVNRVATIAGVDLMKDEIEEVRSDIVKKNNSIKVESYKNGEMSGYKFTASYPSIRDYAQSFSEDDENTKREFKEIKGWFYNAYSFAIVQKGNRELRGNSDDTVMAKAMLSDVKFDFSLNLPYAPLSHNADRVTNDNKTLYWDLADSLKNDIDKTVNVQFKIWNKNNIIATAVVIAILVLIAFNFYNKAKKINDVNEFKKYKNAGNAALVIGVILASVSLYMAFSIPKFTDNTQIVNDITIQTMTDNKDNKDNKANDQIKQTNQKKSTNIEATQAEQELKSRGVNGTVLASSKGHSNNGYVSLVNNNGQYQIVTYDTKNGRVGTTPYARNILYFTDKKPTGGGSETIIFNMTVLNDIHDNDDNAGVWEGANHNIPVYAAYKFDGSGNLVPGMLTTGKGAKPSHYQEYFYETRNVDTINLFLTEMMALQKNIADNKVSLP